jgi:signal peptidase I
MAELIGSLSSFEVAGLVRFLCGLGKSGDLLITHGHWIGQLSVDRGRLTAAAVDDEEGASALEFITAAMRGGEFEFSEGPPSLAPNLDLGADPLVVLERVAAAPPEAWVRLLPAPTAIPRLVEARVTDETELVLGRAALYVLLDIDGSRDVRHLAARLGLVRSLRALGRLRELGLIVFEDGALSASRGDGDSPQGSASMRQASAPRAPYQDFHLSPSTVFGGRFAAWWRRLKRRRLVALSGDLAQAVVVTGLLILGIRSVVQNFRVEGVSMEPTFDGGQALIVNRAAYLHLEHTLLAGLVPTTGQGSISYVFGGPQRGDVAVFQAPPEPGTNYIKRVIGLPGETILIQRGQVFVNGQRLDEPYVKIPATYNFPSDGTPMVVPDDNYFVLGDNRPDSFDSHLGWVVPVDNLIGRAWLRYWPPDELGVVQPGQPARAAELAAR